MNMTSLQNIKEIMRILFIEILRHHYKKFIMLSENKIQRPSDGIIVLKQDYQFLLDQHAPYYGEKLTPITAICFTLFNAKSPSSGVEFVIHHDSVSWKVASAGRGEKIEKKFQSPVEFGHLLPRTIDDAKYSIQHQFWIWFNKTKNTVSFYNGDISNENKPMFEERINPWDLPKAELQKYPVSQAGLSSGLSGKFEFELDTFKISYFEDHHSVGQPNWIKWKLYENNAKPLSPVLKEPGNFYGAEEHTPLIDYPLGIQHLYAVTKQKNLRDLAFMLKSSKINESWEDVPAAIHYSILTKQGRNFMGQPIGILNHLFRLKQGWEFKELQLEGRDPQDLLNEITTKRKAYIRFQTVAPSGDAPGSKLVLEVWPPHCCSVIHNHGEAFGVVKPLSGSIRVQNFHRLGFGEQKPYAEYTYHAGSYTWMSEHSYGVHRLINPFKQTCITIQSYRNGENTTGTFSVVAKGKFAFNEEEREFLGQYSPQNDWENYIKGLTAKTEEDKQFISDVIDYYGLKEIGSLDLSFRKFCYVIREEYENLNKMFNYVFQNPSKLPKLPKSENETIIKDSNTKPTASTMQSEAEIKRIADSKLIRQLIESQDFEKAVNFIKEMKDFSDLREIIRKLRETGKGQQIARLAQALWIEGGSDIVLKIFKFRNGEKEEFMKLGVEGKKSWLYLGPLKNGAKNGKGDQFWDSGAHYKGEFRNDMKEGYGIYQHSNGSRYQGNWEQDMKNGKGVFNFENGEKYTGFYRNNDRDGKGEYIYNDGTRYVGDWTSDLKDGAGIYYMNNGDRYEGHWRNDKLHGDGTIYKANGMRIDRRYVNGKKV